MYVVQKWLIFFCLELDIAEVGTFLSAESFHEMVVFSLAED